LHGLLEHVVGILEKIDKYCELYPELNQDYLRIAAVFHDVGKVFSYDWKISVKITDVGRLHGHTALGYHLFMNLAEINWEDQTEKSEAIKNVGHIILSHHGSYENQAPVVPMTLEATLFSNLDAIDADLNHILTLTKETQEGWTGYIKSRERFYYKTETEEKQEEKPKTQKITKKKSTQLFEHKED
jgi:3'-5' exoribonuclease